MQTQHQTALALRFLSLFLIIGTIGFLSACVDATGPTNTRNPNIVEIPDKYDGGGYGSFHMGEWASTRIYYTPPIRWMELNVAFEIERDSTIFVEHSPFYIRANRAGTRLLYVQSEFFDVSSGSLTEMDLETGAKQQLLSNQFNISSAAYEPGDTSIIYYSYGRPLHVDAGYYRLSLTTGERTPILAHLSEISASEVINGFDLHPDNTKILFPVVRRGKVPLIVEYNLHAETSDTLNVRFDLSWNRICLWLRYNHDGTKILYSQFPRHALSIAPADDSEIGVIDRASLTKTVFDINTEPGFRSVSVFPNWSPDERHIIYGSAPLFKDDHVGRYRLYILKNLPAY